MATSSAENKHRIAVAARVRDNSGGTAFAFALTSEQTATSLKTKIKLGQLTTTDHMVELGTFGSNFTDVSGNVEHSFVFTDLGAQGSDLVDYDESTNAGKYYVYLYVRDIFNNMVIQPHPSNPIQMKSDTIAVAEFDGFFLSTDYSNAREFAEYRAGAPNPHVTQKDGHDMFDFYNNTRTDKLKLYANVTLSTEESVVNNVRLVAFGTSYDLDLPTHVNKIANFMESTEVYNNKNPNLFNQTNYDDGINEIVINKVYDNYSDTTGATLSLATTYYVYSVMQDIGLDKPVVQLVRTVTTGAVPNLTSYSASIAEV